ncbi:cyclodeaminase/cyclohydrolase family protein [Agrococcus citreus]|uniref:Cyclodeaminase/cyclohydrolase domain-containing protein n=1 Tax=Agrococcus citreus TaxID=84643 RepID=A0ABP4JDS9_9MICO
MSERVWSRTVEQLLRGAGSTDPTPGSGSAAAVAGALGISLVRKAVTITGEADALVDRADALLERAGQAADADVVAFGALIDARGTPEDDDGQRAAREDALATALIAATEAPLDLLEVLVDALAVAVDAEPLVKQELVSDVLAGADLVRGAARAALRAVDLDLGALDDADAGEAAPLRARRDACVAALEQPTSLD